jgi:inosose dehydratase
LEESKKKGRSFLDAVRAGIFTVPGDSEGAIDFKPILRELANVNYEGWLMVEAEQDPNIANPLEYALMARRYLREVTGL